MKRPSLAMLILAAGLLARPVRAEVASSFDLCARLGGAEHSVASMVGLIPGLEIDAGRGRLWFDGSGVSTGGRLRLQAARAAADARVARFGPGEALLLVAVTREERRGKPALQALRTEARLGWSRRRAGGWIGAGGQLSSDGGHAPRRGLLGIGGWARTGTFTFSAALDQTEDVRTTIFPAVLEQTPESTWAVLVPERRDHESLTLSHAHTRLGWSRGPLEVETVAGLTFGRYHAPRRWIQARTALGLTRQLALVATAGLLTPQWFALDASRERRATLGVRLVPAVAPSGFAPGAPRPAVTSWRVKRIAEGRYALEVRAPGARAVEIMGDMTGWEAFGLAHLGGSRWRAELDMTPGVHRLNLRLDDGPWRAPLGVATAPDGFNGEVGIIVVE